jgi:hypothetical protein
MLRAQAAAASQREWQMGLRGISRAGAQHGCRQSCGAAATAATAAAVRWVVDQVKALTPPPAVAAGAAAAILPALGAAQEGGTTSSSAAREGCMTCSSTARKSLAGLVVLDLSCNPQVGLFGVTTPTL